MPIPALLNDCLKLPIIAAPMFIVSTPPLVLAQCKSGIVGSFPALNARPAAQLDDWLSMLKEDLSAYARANPAARVAPFAVNQIVHSSNDRLEQDLKLCVKHRVPLVITSLRPPSEVVQAVHAYGGLVFHDVINLRHAEKAAAQGVDGIIAVCAGAGGHAGTLSPFALVKQIREIFPGTLVLSGAMSTGADVLAAQAMGADLAYLGTRFIATVESNASSAYKQMLVDAHAEDIVNTSLFSGIPGNYLRASVASTGMDPDRLPSADKSSMDFGTGTGTGTGAGPGTGPATGTGAGPATGSGPATGFKAWKDIWSAGQSVSGIHEIETVDALVGRLAAEYEAARVRLRCA